MNTLNRIDYRRPATGRRMSLFASATVILALIGPLSLSAAEISVRASLQPQQISLRQAAQLTVEISGAGSGKVLLPQVPNLEFVFFGQMASAEWNMGSLSRKIVYSFQILPATEGLYTIPSFAVEVGNQKIMTTPLTLQVGQGQAAATPAPSTPAQPQQPAPATPVTAPPPSAPAPASPSRTAVATSKPTINPNESAVLQLFSNKTEVYVGQVVPITIKLFVRADRQAELGNAPMRFLSDAFTFNAPTKLLEQTRETVDGIPYNVALWNATVTPVKTGDYQVSMELPLRVVERVRERRPGGMDDSFFDAFFTQYRMVDKELQSPTQNWKVLPLPSDGKPDSFAGAIGEFSVSVKVQPDKVKVGEPINVEMVVEGKGNFDRVNAPVLGTTDGFKTYSPTSKIELRDDLAIEGRKVFTEAVIPLKIGFLPQISFSFFNPELKQYVTRTVEPPRIVITDAPAAPVVAAPLSPTVPAVDNLAAAAKKAKNEEDSKSNEPTLVPIKVELSPFVANFQPVFYNPVFVGAQSLPLLALVAAFAFAQRQRRLENDPDFARSHETNRAVRAQLEKMNTAVTRNDTVAFFTAARRAVQHRLAEHWRVKADDITFDVISQHSAELADSLRSLFLVADEISYSGEARTDVALTDWQKAIVALLSRLEKKV